MPIIVEDGRFAKFWRAGEGPLSTKHVQVQNGAEQRVRPDRVEAPVEQQSAASAGSALLMCLTAGLLTSSVLISLTLLWLAFKGIEWLLFR